MRPRNLLVLALVALAMGAFIAFFERDLPSTDERLKQEKKVLGVEKDDVSAVSIEPKDGSAVRLEKEAPAKPADDEKDEAKGEKKDDAFTPAPTAEWRLTAPLAARADRTRAEELVRALVDLEHSRELDGVDRAAAGLDAPRYKVRVATAKQELELAVGEKIPASQDVYVALADGPVYQVSGSFVDSLARAPGDWRDRKVFPGTRADVERIKLRSGERETLLARRGEDFWVESPLTDRADSQKTNEALTRLTDLEVSTFLDAPPEAATLGLDPPAATVEVVRKDRPEAWVVELGAAVPGEEGARYARAAGQLFTTKSELAASTELPVADWRSRKWTAEQVFRIEKATLQDDQGELLLERKDADWYRGTDKIDYASASDVLYALTDVEATQVVDPGAPEVAWMALAKPTLSVDLALQDDDGEALELFTALDGSGAAKSSDREAVLLLAAETVTKVKDAIAKVRAAPAQKDEPAADAGDETGEDDSAGDDEPVDDEG